MPSHTWRNTVWARFLMECKFWVLMIVVCPLEGYKSSDSWLLLRTFGAAFHSFFVKPDIFSSTFRITVCACRFLFSKGFIYRALSSLLLHMVSFFIWKPGKWLDLHQRVIGWNASSQTCSEQGHPFSLLSWEFCSYLVHNKYQFHFHLTINEEKKNTFVLSLG